jgi:hypothetical protein
MLAGIMAVLGAIFSVVAKIIAVIPWWLWLCIVAFFLGGLIFYGGSCRDFCCKKTPKPRPEKWDELTVVKATTGVTLECNTGARGRRTKTVSLQYVASPSNSPLDEQSRASLERLAGAFVRTRHQGILRPAVDDMVKPVSAVPEEEEWREVKCDGCGGSGKISNICEVNCFFCQKNPACIDCGGAGKLKLSYDTIEQCHMVLSAHLGDNGCKECFDNHGPCSKIVQELRDIIAEDHKNSRAICPTCAGTGKYFERPLESKMVVGVIYSAYGQCLNTEQVRLGMAKLLAGAPKEWKVFEDEAKKKNLGIWKKEPTHKR